MGEGVGLVGQQRRRRRTHLTPRRRWVAVLVVAGVLLLPAGGSVSVTAEGPGSVASVSRPAGEPSDAPERSPQKAVAGPPKKTGAPAKLDRATPSDRDSPLLNILWLLTGSSRRH
jgi:hypothetical protein